MNLCDVMLEKEKYETLEKKLKERIIILRTRLEKLTSKFDKERVDGGVAPDNLDIISKIVDIEQKLDYVKEMKINCVELVEELEEKIKQSGDRNQQIYMEFRYKKYSADKIGMRYGITDRQVYRIIKEIEGIKKRASI